MSNIIAIAHKELKGYFASPIAYVVLGFFALMFGFFFYSLLLYFDRQAMQMAGPGGPPFLPLMWSRDASQSFLRSPGEMRALLEATGFRVRVWDDVTDEFSVATPVAALPPYAISKLVMGDELQAIMDAGQRSRDERRMLSIHAVCDRL